MSDDYLAGYLAKTEKPPSGRIHLHAFVKRNSLYKAAIYEDGDGQFEPKRKNYWKPPKQTVLCGELEWKARTKGSPVCKIPGRCVLAEVIE